MSRTSSELINRILADLDVVGAGQDAEAEDFADIEQRVETTVAELNARDILNVNDVEEIPDEIFEGLVEYMKLRHGSGYGKPDADPVALQVLEDKLKEICRPRAARRTLQADGMYRSGRGVGGFNFRNGG